MTTSNRASRWNTDLLRPAAVGLAVTFVCLIVATSQAFAASQDGTSNAIQFTAATAVIDQQHHRVIVPAAAAGGLVAGERVANVEVTTPRYTIILQDVLVSSFSGTTTSLSLNFAEFVVA